MGKDSLCVIEMLKKSYGERIDFSKGIGATGHSFGGNVAYWLCQYSDEVTCGANIDGGVFGDYEGMVMKKPFLQICCKENYNTMTRSLIRTEAFVRCEVFEDMKHIGFSDAKFMIPIAAVVGKMDGIEMYKKLSGCHFEMFNKYLK